MATMTINNNASTPRTKRFRENMIKHGFKRVQKWVFDIESATIQKQMGMDLANFKQTQEEKEWNDFAAQQLENLKDWK